MTKYNVLVIDDELDNKARRHSTLTRRECYMQLSKAFNIEFLDALDDLSGKLKYKSFHAILADFVLSRWHTDVQTILAQLDGRFPVALISRRWGPNFEKLRVTLANNPEVAQLFTWEDLEDSERRGLVVIWLEKAIEARKGISALRLEEDELIRILHLSDVQFGSELPGEFSTETDLIAVAVRKKWGGPPTFIAITGDVTERGLPSEFERALAWLNSLAVKLDPGNWSAERFLLIPGNHDLCWPLGLSTRINAKGRSLSVSDTEILNMELRPYALTPFRQFAKKIGCGYWGGISQYWTSGTFRQLGLIIFGYNTCEDLDSWCMPTNKIVDSTFAQMFSEVRTHREDSANAVVLGLMHHPLTADKPKDQISNPEVFYKNLSSESSTMVIPNGHFHASGWDLRESAGGSVLELTAGTVTKEDRPNDALRSISLIEFIRSGGRITGVSVEHCLFGRRGLDMTKKNVFTRQANGKLLRDSG